MRFRFKKWETIMKGAQESGDAKEKKDMRTTKVQGFCFERSMTGYDKTNERRCIISNSIQKKGEPIAVL